MPPRIRRVTFLTGPYFGGFDLPWNLDKILLLWLLETHVILCIWLTLIYEFARLHVYVRRFLLSGSYHQVPCHICRYWGSWQPTNQVGDNVDRFNSHQNMRLLIVAFLGQSFKKCKKPWTMRTLPETPSVFVHKTARIVHQQMPPARPPVPSFSSVKKGPSTRPSTKKEKHTHPHALSHFHIEL